MCIRMSGICTGLLPNFSRDSSILSSWEWGGGWGKVRLHNIFANPQKLHERTTFSYNHANTRLAFRAMAPIEY